MNVALLAAALLLSAPCLRAEPQPRLADERIILHTLAGDMVLALYPDAAPKHVAQMLKLSRLGVYDGSSFFGVAPGFYAELGIRDESASPLSPEQRAAIHRLKAEFSSLRHHAGSLSMARDVKDPDSAETAFSIILADWPDGDRRYTIFGRVESGMDVLGELVKVPRNEEGRPLVRLGVMKAEVAGRAALARMKLAPAQPVEVPKELTAAATQQEGLSRLKAVAGGLMLMVLIGAAAFFCASRFPRALPSLVLINVLIGAFLLLVILTPMAHLHSLLSIVLFLGLLGTLKLMSRFESPA